MFSLNKQNCSRCRSCCVNTIENLSDTHPGGREFIQEKRLSVQGKEKYLCRTAIDQREEQTVNRDVKTSGGRIKYFASDPNAILKWTLNRSAQAKNAEALYDPANIKSSELVVKSLWPSNMMKSENFVDNLQGYDDEVSKSLWCETWPWKSV